MNDFIERSMFNVKETAWWNTSRELTAIGVPPRIEVTIAEILKQPDGSFRYKAFGTYRGRAFDVEGGKWDFKKKSRPDEDGSRF